MDSSKDIELLNTLSEEERAIAISILNDLSTKGESKAYEELLYKDYKEIPVDIETFLTDDRYLGLAWKDAKGKSKVYPFWMNVLKEIFPNNLDTNYDTLLESGARGLGKSEVACGAICSYLMYRVMCLRNPLEFYHLKPTEKIAFAFMNIKLDLAEAIATDKFQKTVQMSPWFMPKGTMTRRNNKDFWLPPDPIELIIGSQSDDLIGRPIFFSFFDEISFLKNQDINIQKKKAMDMIDTAIGGMKTRFIHNGKNPTLLVVASSKRSEQSFMESYIRLLSETSSNNTYVVDKPVWEVKPKGTYSDEIFYIGLGDKYKETKVIPDGADLKPFKEQGYQIIEVPIDFKENALKDLNRMLCDYAGISSFSSNKFISAARLVSVVSDKFENPMPDVIEVGDGMEDKAEYKDFFNMERVPKELKNRPLFIHLDMSISGDKTGIAGVWIVGKKPTSDGNPGKDLWFQPAFSFAIQAPYGRQISFAKNRNFIRWLKEQGFKIKHITSDTFQSYNLQQDLKSDGFECSILSVDRVETIPGEHVGVCKPYEYLKNAIYEGRIKLYKTDLLYNELVQLEKDNNTGKVDHPPKGSKDTADALCGAVYTASGYAEEYAYDYGDNLDLLVDLNKDEIYEDGENKKQMVVSYEDELRKALLAANGLSTAKEEDEDDGFFVL